MSAPTPLDRWRWAREARPGGPASRKAVLVALVAHVDVNGRTRVSQERLAEETGLAVRTVRDQQHALVADGWISVYRPAQRKRAGDGWGRDATVWAVQFNRQPLPGWAEVQPATDRTESQVQPATIAGQGVPPKEETSPLPPKRAAKRSAPASKRRAEEESASPEPNPDPGADEILAALRAAGVTGTRRAMKDGAVSLSARGASSELVARKVTSYRAQWPDWKGYVGPLLLAWPNIQVPPTAAEERAERERQRERSAWNSAWSGIQVDLGRTSFAVDPSHARQAELLAEFVDRFGKYPESNLEEHAAHLARLKADDEARERRHREREAAFLARTAERREAEKEAKLADLKRWADGLRADEAPDDEPDDEGTPGPAMSAASEMRRRLQARRGGANPAPFSARTRTRAAVAVGAPRYPVDATYDDDEEPF